MAPPMNLALRNRLAGWCLEALRDPAAETRLDALAAFVDHADARGTACDMSLDHAAILVASDVFEPADRGIRLRTEFAAELAALRWRAPRFIRALADCRAACQASRAEVDVAWSLCAGAALFNAELFFEVHELLEESWRPAQGPLKTLLQGLIQVAVGLHHHANGNLRGAVALLGEGNAKLARFAPELHGVELARFCAAVEAIRERLRAGSADGPLAVPRLVVRQSSAITR